MDVLKGVTKAEIYEGKLIYNDTEQSDAWLGLNITVNWSGKSQSTVSADANVLYFNGHRFKWMPKLVKIHQNLYLNCAHFIACQLHINKVYFERQIAWI